MTVSPSNPQKENDLTDDLSITVKGVDIAAWKAARKYGIDNGLSMGES